jgi:hypothetical protein
MLSILALSSPPPAFFTLRAEEHRALARPRGKPEETSLRFTLRNLDSQCIWVRRGLFFMEQSIFGALIWVQKLQKKSVAEFK